MENNEENRESNKTKRNYFKRKLKKMNVLDLEKDKLIKIESEQLSKKRKIFLLIVYILALLIIYYSVIQTIISVKMLFNYTQQSIATMKSLKLLSVEINIFEVLMTIFSIGIIVIEIMFIILIKEGIFTIKNFFIYKEKIVISIHGKGDKFYINNINTETKFTKKLNCSFKEKESLKDAIEELLENEKESMDKYKNIIFNIAKIIVGTSVVIGVYKSTINFSKEFIEILKFTKEIRSACIELNLTIIISILGGVLIYIAIIIMIIVLRKNRKEFYRKRIRILRRIRSEI